MARYIDSEAEPTEIQDFGFWHHEDDVFEVCSILLLSNYHILPCDGGWESQDEQWADDIMTWLHIHNRMTWEKRQSEKGEDVLESFLGDGNGVQDIGDLLHD